MMHQRKEAALVQPQKSNHTLKEKRLDQKVAQLEMSIKPQAWAVNSKERENGLEVLQ